MGNMKEENELTKRKFGADGQGHRQEPSSWEERCQCEAYADHPLDDEKSYGYFEDVDDQDFIMERFDPGAKRENDMDRPHVSAKPIPTKSVRS